MANPVLQPMSTPELGHTELHVEFTVGASGAVGTVVRARELDPTTPITKESAAGTYTLLLKEKWVALLGIQGNVIQQVFDKTHGCVINDNGVKSVSTDGAVQIELRGLDGNASLANAASGDVVRVTLKLQYQKQ